jgi:hypothetical protein
VPDATTVWSFRDQLQTHDLVDELFEHFAGYLAAAGYHSRFAHF